MNNQDNERFITTYRNYTNHTNQNPNATVWIVELTLSSQYQNAHRQLIDDWINNCYRNQQPREYGINYLEETNNHNAFVGLAILPNTVNKSQFLLSNDSEILGEAQLVESLYHENETIAINLFQMSFPELNYYLKYQTPKEINTEPRLFKIQYKNPKYSLIEINQ